MVFIIRGSSARSTVGVLLQLGPEQVVPVGHDVLGEVEQDGFLAWRQASCPDQAPADCPIHLWGLFFLVSFDQDRSAMLDRHMGDASLQDDLLPLLGGDLEELPSPLFPYFPDRCEERSGEVGGFLDGVFREFLTDKTSEEGGQVTVAMLRSRVSL